MTNEEAIKIIFNQWQEFLENYIDYGGVSEAYKLALKALEQSKWISVNEQLPIKSDYYLATIKESSGERVVRSVWYDGEWKFMSIEQNVLAWMPLPELYKEESDV